MRDPKRIQSFCNQLADMWRTVPDWRFGQLIVNVFHAYRDETGRNLFFVEDEELFRFIQKFFYGSTEEQNDK